MLARNERRHLPAVAGTVLGEKERVRGIRELLRLYVLRLPCISGAVRKLQQLDILSSLKRDIPFFIFRERRHGYE